MRATPDREQVEESVRKCISEALAVPIDRVVPSARLVTDLGAESIDVADIHFRIEHDLDIRIDRREMTQSVGVGVSLEEFDRRFTVGFVIDYITGMLSEKP